MVRDVRSKKLRVRSSRTPERMSSWSFSFIQVKMAPVGPTSRVENHPEGEHILRVIKSKGVVCMKLPKASLQFCCFSLSVLFTGGSTTPVLSAVSVREAAQGTDKFIYADFETIKENRPVSNRGGLVQLFSYQENAANPSRFKGAQKGDPNAPDVVRLSKDDPNKAITFDYELRMPNQWAGVTVEVHGQPDKDGKPVS